MSLDTQELTRARVISQEKGLYRVEYDGLERLAEVSGKFIFENATVSDFPTVGDYVWLSNIETDGNAIIQKIDPRASVFVRRASGTSKQEQAVAANFDIVFLCMSLNQDFNLRRLERYLSISWQSGARPIIVLTKADLCEDIEVKLAEVSTIAFGVDALVTSSLEKDGIGQIMKYLQNKVTATFLGSSGVGKSTLINCLLDAPTLTTQEIGNNDKGRHTTTHRELIKLQNGAMVIDTPGMRELGMWDTQDGIDTAFDDVVALTENCKFRNCTHTTEPGCAVLAAIKSGELTKERFESYKKLMAENAYNEDSDSFLAVKEKKFKEIANINKRNRKR